MSGAIVDLPVAVCRACKIVYVIDERMYEEPERCPKCGRRPATNDPKEGETDV